MNSGHLCKVNVTDRKSAKIGVRFMSFYVEKLEVHTKIAYDPHVNVIFSNQLKVHMFLSSDYRKLQQTLIYANTLLNSISTNIPKK